MRVLELSDREAAAAYAGKLFARWGAEVVRVEPPDRPSPHEHEDRYLHGGKRRVALDYRTPEEREVLDRLAATCDVLLTDAPAPAVREHALLDLGGEGGPAARVSITPFGLTGPYANAPATEASLWALSGHSNMMGDQGRPPLSIPGHHVAYQAGNFGYIGALAVLYAARRNSSLASPVIEVSELECMATLHGTNDTTWVTQQRVVERSGNRFAATVANMWPCKDGWVAASMMRQYWEPFAQMMGHPELIEESSIFATNESRLAHRDEFDEFVTELFRDWPKKQLVTEGQEQWRLPMGYQVTIADLLADPHLAARDFWRPVEGAVPPMLTPGSPFRFLGEERPPERASVPPGTDTDAVLAELPASPPVPRSAQAGAPNARPLEGLRVLDLARVWSGPLASRTLADLGADVVLVEGPSGRGTQQTPTGSGAPSYLGTSRDPWNNIPSFNKRHRNRRSLCLDLKEPRGRELFLRLVADSDIVIENFSASVMERLGLGYEQLREANARIIYLRMPSYGVEGPYRDYIAYGNIVEPMAAMTTIIGYTKEEPRSTSTALVDAVAGVAGAIAMMTALERRDRTGEGAHIDLSQHESAIALLGEYTIEHQLTGQEPAVIGVSHPEHVPHGTYRCAGADDWIAIAARDEQEWNALCAVAARGWEHDPRFATQEARRSHRADLDAAIEAWTADEGKLDLQTRLLAAGVPAGGVLRNCEYLQDPHLRARGYFPAIEHASTGPQHFDGLPLVFGGQRGYDWWRPAPVLGEHNAEVLRERLGLDGAAVAELLAAGVVVDKPPPG